MAQGVELPGVRIHTRRGNGANVRCTTATASTGNRNRGQHDGPRTCNGGSAETIAVDLMILVCMARAAVIARELPAPTRNIAL